jgi:hypothetical protein
MALVSCCGGAFWNVQKFNIGKSISLNEIIKPHQKVLFERQKGHARWPFW